MLKSDLLQLIANGENSGIEFKRDDVRPEQLAKEIVALANFQGGRILLGVDDDGTIVGIQRENLEAWVMDTVFGRYVHPQILPFYEEVVFDEGKRVAIIGLSQGTAKPYVVRNHGREDIYIRVGSTSRLATREQQARLFAIGGMLHSELLPVSGSSLGDLSLDRLIDYARNLLGEPEVPGSEPDWEELLLRLGFLTRDAAGKAVCTVAGFALLGLGAHRSLPQAGVRWMASSGVDKDHGALDDVKIHAPLVGLFRGAMGKGRMVVEPGLIERVVERMTPFISTESMETDLSMRRERSFHDPVEAIRESLLNALVHRDWTRLGEVEIVSFSDRLEITCPGALSNSMTVEKMLAGQRSPRNPLLVSVMRDYGYVDARGMGVRRKIVPLVREASGQEAIFEATEDYVRVVMPRAS